MKEELDPTFRADDGEKIKSSEAAQQMIRGSLGVRGLLSKRELTPDYVEKVIFFFQESSGSLGLHAERLYTSG